MIENFVNISGYVYGECQYNGCRYNDGGYCDIGDGDFIFDILKTRVQGELYFNCKRKDVPIGYCDKCGSKLEKMVQIHDKKYGDKYEWNCPECG